MESFSQFASDLDQSTRNLLDRGRRLTEILKQPQYAPLKVEEQVVSIYSGVNGYLDNFDNSKIKDFENKLLDEIKSNAPDILNSIRDTGKLEGKTEEKLKNILDKMKENFNA